MIQFFESRGLVHIMFPLYLRSRECYCRKLLVFFLYYCFSLHQHDDLDDFEGRILLVSQAKYSVKVYIDSRDPSIPYSYLGNSGKYKKAN